MAIVDVGQIVVELESFKVEGVLELHIKETLNNHAALYLFAKLKDGQKDSPLGSISNHGITCIAELYVKLARENLMQPLGLRDDFCRYQWK